MDKYDLGALLIIATINDKYSAQAFVFVPKIENSLRQLMENSNCSKEDYSIEVL